LLAEGKAAIFVCIQSRVVMQSTQVLHRYRA